MYIEDVYEEFYTIAMVMRVAIQRQDLNAMKNFYNLCSANSQLTEKQANFILRLLDKYKEQSIALNYDYTQHLQAPKWKQPFRVIDESKKIFIETDKQGMHWVCIKFPFSLIKDYENESILRDADIFRDTEVWDKDRKLRMISVYECNFLKLDEFVRKHNFEIDPKFDLIVSTFEEIWQQPETVVPHSVIENSKVVIKNAPECASQYFELNQNLDINNDLFLAKLMGYPLLHNTSNSIIEKICSTMTNSFWSKDIKTFVELADSIDGKVAILLDRTEDQKLWISNFVNGIRKHSKQSNVIKVAFRESNKTNPEFNTWLNNENLTGDLESAKYLIFKSKTPKWLHKGENNIKIIATNNTFLPSSAVMREWLTSHPCVIYINEYKPVFSKREEALVEL